MDRSIALIISKFCGRMKLIAGNAFMHSANGQSRTPVPAKAKRNDLGKRDRAM